MASCQRQQPEGGAAIVEADTLPPPLVSVSDSLLRVGHTGNPDQWPMYGGDYGQMRHSPLDQINTANVNRLRPAWIYQMGAAESWQTTPLVIGRAMYLTTSMVEQMQSVVKLDAATGRKIWETPIRIGTALFCCGPNNRGVAAWGDKVYLATLDARLIAFNTADGKIVWDVPIAEPGRSHGNTSAPVTFDGKVFIGTSGGEWPTRGFYRAFDAETGKLLWNWNSIPSPQEGGWWGEWQEQAPGTALSLNRDIAREKKDSARYADSWQQGGGPIWMPASIDPALGLLFVSIGNANPDYNATARPGDNRWTSSICALRAADGSQAWCYQWMPHDVWDYDGASPPFLFDVTRNGKSVPAVAAFTKVGFLYVLDRRDGKLLTRSDPYVPQENLFAVPGTAPLTMAPGSAGGTEWSPGAFGPETGLAYSVNVDWPMGYAADTATGRCAAGPGECLGLVLEKSELKPSRFRGNVSAVDPSSGKVVWQTWTRLPMIGGVVVTAGGLLFAGQSDGSFDAWSTRDGAHLWQFRTGAGCNAAPMTYRIDGRQFVAVACGGSFILRSLGNTDFPGGTLVVFALPEAPTGR